MELFAKKKLVEVISLAVPSHRLSKPGAKEMRKGNEK